MDPTLKYSKDDGLLFENPERDGIRAKESYPYLDQALWPELLNHRSSLIFPTGTFVGVYFSEELKFAVKLGYTVLPMKGYLFEKGEGSPFKDFASSLSENRIREKQKGNAVMSYIYKLIMNSLYGRLGISPERTVNNVVDDARRKHLLQTSEKFLYSHPLENNWHNVAYPVNTQSTVDKWTPHKNSAVQMGAAITAYARIHLYPYIARDDCYYTDTDSVVLGHPLPCDVLSSSEIGKWKLEDKIKKGPSIFRTVCLATMNITSIELGSLKAISYHMDLESPIKNNKKDWEGLNGWLPRPGLDPAHQTS
ncbi:hypothetical protein HAX54_044602 [Datura stramonium]|uniref:DNA-directed DNA polymerase n=1 Tax=Datura stramonium TaxID=4076 RepID=A0ABS8WIU5_DATST|nr:hypothetical protein [Datura stramonium]